MLYGTWQCCSKNAWIRFFFSRNELGSSKNYFLFVPLLSRRDIIGYRAHFTDFNTLFLEDSRGNVLGAMICIIREMLEFLCARAKKIICAMIHFFAVVRRVNCHEQKRYDIIINNSVILKLSVRWLDRYNEFSNLILGIFGFMNFKNHQWAILRFCKLSGSQDKPKRFQIDPFAFLGMRLSLRSRTHTLSSYLDKWKRKYALFSFTYPIFFAIFE